MKISYRGNCCLLLAAGILSDSYLVFQFATAALYIRISQILS